MEEVNEKNCNKILHICSNYPYTKIFPNLIYQINSVFGNNYLYCPIINKKNIKLATYANLEDEIYKKNEDFVTIEKCFSPIDKIFFYPKRYKIFRKIINNYNIKDFNFIMAHSLMTDGWVARKIFQKYKIPYVVFVQNSDINFFISKFPFLIGFAIDILNKAKKIIFCSEVVKNFTLDKLFNKEKKIEIEKKTVIIPFAIDDKFFENEKEVCYSKGKEINVLTVGTINKNKNQLTVAQACQKIKDKGLEINYNLVGKIEDNEYFNKLKKFDFVNYLGVKSIDELIQIYRENDVFVLTSIYETFGLVYAEAISQGLPIVYSKGQGFDGNFGQGIVGYSVEKEDCNSIANAILSIKNNKKCFLENCLNNSQKFEWKNVAKKYYEAIVE